MIIWGDDRTRTSPRRHPPVLRAGLRQVEARPWQRSGAGPNVWGDPRRRRSRSPAPAAASTSRPGSSSGRRHGVRHKPLHTRGGPPFLNTIMFLDYDRGDSRTRSIAFQVNCYGRRVIAQRGRARQPREPARRRGPGSAVSFAEAMHGGRRRDRAGHAGQSLAHALIASSSWRTPSSPTSTTSSTPTSSRPALYEALRLGDYETWRKTPLEAIGRRASRRAQGTCWSAPRRPSGASDECDFIETWSFNSNKCSPRSFPER